MLLYHDGNHRRRRPERHHPRVDICNVGRHNDHLAIVDCHVVNDVRPIEASDGALRG